jgi:hypothetical protein
MFLPQSDRPSFAPILHNWHNYSSVYFYFKVKVKIKVKLKLYLCLNKHQTMKTLWGNGGIASRFLWPQH